MSEDNNFIWAADHDANIKEPHDELKDVGWQYNDIPTASHFNWIFNKVTSDINRISPKLAEIDDNLESTMFNLHETEGVANSAHKLAEHARGCAKQICDYLRFLEEQLSSIHGDMKFAPLPIPDKQPHRPHTEDDTH